MSAVPLPAIRWRKAGRRWWSVHVPRAGHSVQTGQNSGVTGLRGLVEGRSHHVVEYLPPELKVVVTVFLTVSNPRIPGFVKGDEPGLGSSYQDIVVSKCQDCDGRTYQ